MFGQCVAPLRGRIGRKGMGAVALRRELGDDLLQPSPLGGGDLLRRGGFVA